jgi:hypothetical protein
MMDDTPLQNIYLSEDSLPIMTLLPESVNESSGLVFFNDQIWTHNDSGDGPQLFEVSSTTAEVNHKIELINAQAKDWEELAQDNDYVYVGDFGNNNGNRDNLTIYKVPKTSLTEDSTTATAEKIFFSYPDQTIFNAGAYNHNFDCEAMISAGDNLYLFSKNHENGKCRLYSLPKTPGTYSANLLTEMNTDGLITAAAIDTEQQVVVLLGYNVYNQNGKWHNKPFVWLLTDYDSNDFFSGNSLRINLPVEKQMEGICYAGNGMYIISSEGEGGETGFLFSFDAEKWIR